MVTIDELVGELANRGYRITHRAVKYYLDLGLLPQPDKRGGYGQGVRLVFPDKGVVLAKLLRIFELKGRGYKLSEIRHLILEEHCKEAIEKKREELKRYIKIQDRFYFVIDDLDSSRGRYSKYSTNSLSSILLSPEVMEMHEPTKFNLDFVESACEELETRGLYLPTHLYQNQSAYRLAAMYEAYGCLDIRREWDIEWDLFESLLKKHSENLSKYFYWPVPDNVRISEASIGFMQRNLLNQFGIWLGGYLSAIRDGFISDSFHSRYDNVYIFIRDFLAGDCAFVPFTEYQNTHFLLTF